ncbi:MAG: hypothetical protein QOI79_1357, partial [Mycobacterium sp.]|nr:hypothetical protein [Mycobacterium sp.]
RGTRQTDRLCFVVGLGQAPLLRIASLCIVVGAAHDSSVISRYSVYNANQVITTTAATSMISKNNTTRRV